VGSDLPFLRDGVCSSGPAPDWVFTAARSIAKGFRVGTSVVSPCCGTGVLLADDMDAYSFALLYFQRNSVSCPTSVLQIHHQ
jgi:hypothetical protein